MKSKTLLIFIWLIAGYGSSGIALAQWGRQIQFQFTEFDRDTKIDGPTTINVHDSTVYDVFRYRHPDPRFSLDKPVSSILLGVKLSPSLKHSYMPDMRSMSREFRSFSITDSSEAIVIAMGITPQNVSDYRYHVIEDDSIELVKWSAIPGIEQKYGAKEPYAFIGRFKAVNRQILVEVVNIKNYVIREGVIFDWHTNYKPVLKQIAIYTPEPSRSHTYPDDPKDMHPNFFNITATDVNRGMATRFDKKTNIPLDMKFGVDSIRGISLYFKNHVAIGYSIFLVKHVNNKTDTTVVAWNVYENMYPIEAKGFNQPGKYEFIIQRAGDLRQWPEDQKIRIPFEVKPPPLSQKKVSIKQLIPYTVATLCGVAFLFFIYRRQSRAKLQRTERDKEMIGLKLRSIRAQLNPHFMFNALTSIQNLINKNNISGANYYLSKFAGLTRQVLDSSNEEMLSLEDELQVLDDYLQMEQLRFNFKYNIIADEQLDRANIEIPAMLLQPFVENAIKHGIATLGNDGEIEVNASRQQSDLVLSVIDNGIGFTPNGKAQGYGIKLSEDRVALLNQNYPGQTITLQIEAQQPGTRVIIRLSNWIS
ncbi:MAG: hypothetical protein JWR50_814 [Mucilaginibacter sp.]|nr:hypothetical protein [Mucilaginibacter sp.]